MIVRALELRRLALIGDSVFAVSITLNARAVPIPRFDGGALGPVPFGPFVEGVAAVLMSVVVASAFWLGHWRYFRSVRSTGPGLVAAHFFFLLALILLPVSTDLYATNRSAPIAILVYGLNLLLLTIVALIFRFTAIRHTPGRVVTRYDWMGLAGVIALFSIAVALSFRAPDLAQWCWYIGLASPLIETWLGRRLEKKLGRGWTA